MKKYLLIPSLLFICIAFVSVAVFAQDVPKKKRKTEIRYALSGTLTVYAKPFTTARVIGQLIYNETIQVVVGSDEVERGSNWVHIVSPYEGFFQQSKPPKDIKKEKIAVISRKKPKVEKKQEKKKEESKSEADEKSTADADEIKKEDDESETEEIEIAEEDKPAAARELFGAKTTMMIGVGNSVYTVPEEKGYETSGAPMDIYFEYLNQNSFFANIRVGLNSAAEEDDDYKVSTISLYIAYRATFDKISSQDFKSFGFAGPAAMMSTLSGNADKSATSVGLVVGLGCSYRLFWELRVGAQIVYFTNQQDFDVVKRFAGSTQSQLTMDYSF